MRRREFNPRTGGTAGAGRLGARAVAGETQQGPAAQSYE
jgi:hypothetical protein